jgi:hypothetical protein
MSEHVTRTFELTSGQDTYSPAVSSTELKFSLLQNVEPRLKRLRMSTGFTSFQDLGVAEPVYGFGMYTNQNGASEFYAFTKTKIYRFDFNTSLFDTTPIYSALPSTTDAYVVLPWYDCLYLTKPGAGYLKLAGSGVTVIDAALSAKFGVIAASHSHLANITSSDGTGQLRTKWSDLDLPESFDINPASSEADFFDIEPPGIRITGETYQRGTPLIYLESAIWRAEPIGYPGGFITKPMFPGLGCIFENAVISHNELDFFIGADNFYVLNGTQPIPIGNDIWETFIADVKSDGTAVVRVFKDTRKNQICWVYTNTSDNLWSVVYNSKENKWCERDPQEVVSFFDAPRIGVSGIATFDDFGVLDTFNAETASWNDAGKTDLVVLNQLAGISFANGILTKPLDTFKRKYAGAQFAGVAETFDFFFDDVTEVKEFLKFTITFTGGGSPAPVIEISSRDRLSQADDWQAAVLSESVDDTYSGYFRAAGVGKFVKFRILIDNTDTDYITDLLFFSLTKVEDAPPISVK